MNVSVENLAPCRKLLRVEVEAATVDAEFEKITKEFLRHAHLAGFRPGKAPRALVERSYSARITEEVKQKLIPDAFKQALADQKIRAVGLPDIEELQFRRGAPLQFTATIETAPEFALPDYNGLPVKVEKRAVTDEDVAKAIDILRDQRADFKDVSRPVHSGDYVVVNYAGTCEGKPLTDYAPTARGLTAQKDFWLHIDKDSFVPGFTEQLIGAHAGEHHVVEVDFPTDFVSKELSGRRGHYELDILQVKERARPELNDEFAKAYGAENVTKLQEGVRRDLTNELNHKQKTSIRNQLVRALLDRVSFDLPESFVVQETRNVVFDVVRENQQRGVTKEAIDKQKEQIYAFANSSAKERVKMGFLLSRIAEKEGIQAEQNEVTQRILFLAQQYQIKPDRLIKQLQERDGIAEIVQQIVTSKVLDFLQGKAQIEEAEPAPAPAA